MKGSNAISATAATGSPRPRIGRSSVRPPTRTSGKGFALTGPSDPPDPGLHAYRADLADAALAGRVIASHYADPLERAVTKPALLRSEPSDGSEPLAELPPGSPFLLLDDTLGWAWGYGGEKRLVGYVESAALSG
ncbi:MAG TPA: SH3 domain-containing protein [Sphingomicrobium sp.]|nr:SH3 domain-containing protein [Sphingomicrobium sp.]